MVRAQKLTVTINTNERFSVSLQIYNMIFQKSKTELLGERNT